MSEKRYRIQVVNKDLGVEGREDENVLKAVERIIGHKEFVGCRMGGCGFCRVNDEDQAQDIVLACRIHPTSDLKIEFIGQYGQPKAEWKHTSEKGTPALGQTDPGVPFIILLSRILNPLCGWSNPAAFVNNRALHFMIPLLGVHWNHGEPYENPTHE